MDRSAFDGTSQKVFLFLRSSQWMTQTFCIHKCNWPTVYKISHRGSGFCMSSSTAAAATRVRLSVPMLRQPRTYIHLRLPLGQWWSMKFYKQYTLNCQCWAQTCHYQVHCAVRLHYANSFWGSSKPIIVAILHWGIAINAASFRSANYIKHGLISE